MSAWPLVLMALVSPLAAAPTSPTGRPATSTEGWVVIPLAEYRDLRNKAFPLDPEAGPPPVEWALTRLDCDIRVEGDSALGEARLTVDVLKEGWVRLTLPRGLKVQSARVENRPVALIAEPGRDPIILLSKTGRTLLTLDIATPLTTQSGGESFSLPASNAAIFRVLARLPRPASDLLVNGGVLASREEIENETRVSVGVRPGENLSLHWRRRAAAVRTNLPPKFRSSITEVVGLGEETSTTTAHVTIEMTQGATPSATFRLPAGFTVNQVSGALVADWDARPGTLTVTFLEPLESRARLVLQGETKTPREGTIEIPILRMEAADRETGGVAVEVLGAGEIKGQRAQGLDATDPGELGDVMTGRDSPSLSAFRFRPLAESALSLSVDVARYTPQAVLMANVEEARYDTLLTDEGKRLCRGRYAVRNNQRSFLTVSLPPNAVLWSASVAGRPVRPGKSPSGALLLPLQKTRTGEDAPPFEVDVIYFERSDAWIREGRATLGLPSIDLPISRTGVLLYHSPEFRIAVDRGSFRVAEFEPPSSPAFHPLVDYPGGKEGERAEEKREKDKTGRDEVFQGLVDTFNKTTRSGRLSASLPVHVGLPEVGATAFLTSELTSEGSSPSIAFAYEKRGKR